MQVVFENMMLARFKKVMNDTVVWHLITRYTLKFFAAGDTKSKDNFNRSKNRHPRGPFSFSLKRERGRAPQEQPKFLALFQTANGRRNACNML
jgi:hypothetical protein